MDMVNNHATVRGIDNYLWVYNSIVANTVNMSLDGVLPLVVGNGATPFINIPTGNGTGHE